MSELGKTDIPILRQMLFIVYILFNCMAHTMTGEFADDSTKDRSHGVS